MGTKCLAQELHPGGVAIVLVSLCHGNYGLGCCDPPDCQQLIPSGNLLKDFINLINVDVDVETILPLSLKALRAINSYWHLVLFRLY